MRITTKGRYALRACLAMAHLGENGRPVSIRELSEQEELSSVFLEQIFYKLRKQGIVSSVRGPGGGFRFSRPLGEISVRAIMDASEEGLALAPCSEDGSTCTNTNDCIAHRVWGEASLLVNNYLEGISLGSLIQKYGDTRCEGASHGTFNQ